MTQKKSDAKVSIIIPVYKAEQYLARCIDGILRQTYQNFEIILVDDGSPDRSGEICDQYAQRDQRITAYHKPNGGAADARNYGVAHSAGEYIAFIDSDDYIAEDYIEYLVDLLENNEADISVCAMVETESDTADFSKTDGVEETIVLRGKEVCQRISIEWRLIPPWGKVYKREILAKYPYPIGHICEDEAATPKYYYEAKRVALGNRCLYAYYCNSISVMHSRGEKKNTDAIWTLAHCAAFFEEKNERALAQMFWERYFSYCIRDGEKHDERCYEDIKACLRVNRLNKKMWIYLQLYLVSPKLYRKIKRVGLAVFRQIQRRQMAKNQ